MRKVYLDNLAEFYCPLTGVRLWGDDKFSASPATRFIYVELPNYGFRYLDEPFAEAITKVAGPYLVDGKPDAYFRRLCRGLKGDRIIDFVLHCSSEIVHIGIDTVDRRLHLAAQATVPAHESEEHREG